MNLDDYLLQLDGGNTSAPDTLTLQPTFVKQLSDLYVDAEARGLERGGPLLCDRGTRTFAIGDIAEGLATSMNIPVTNHVGNFGDVHAHPSASIGHGGGYSAHSMLDLLNFKKTRDKPFWIQFVSCGPWLYAMVQVTGVSKWDNTVQKFVSDRGDFEGYRMQVAIEDCVGGRENWRKITAKAGADTDDKVRAKLYEEYKPKAKIGPLMQHLSVKHCAEFAREYNFFFYTGQGGALTRMLSLE